MVQGWFRRPTYRSDLAILERFPKVRTGRPDHGWSSHFDNEIGFSQEFLLKNHLLRAWYLGFDWSGWIVLIKSEILVTTGMVWLVSSDKWKAPIKSLLRIDGKGMINDVIMTTAHDIICEKKTAQKRCCWNCNIWPNWLTSHRSNYCLYYNGIPEFVRKCLMLTVK